MPGAKVTEVARRSIAARNEEDWASTIIVTRARGSEVTAEDIGFLHALVGEETVGCLRVRPILARELYAPAHAITNLLQQPAKLLNETGILESCLVDLALRPMFDGTVITIILATVRQPTRDVVPLERIKAPPIVIQCQTMNHKRRTTLQHRTGPPRHGNSRRIPPLSRLVHEDHSKEVGLASDPASTLNHKPPPDGIWRVL